MKSVICSGNEKRVKWVQTEYIHVEIYMDLYIRMTKGMQEGVPGMVFDGSDLDSAIGDLFGVSS